MNIEGFLFGLAAIGIGVIVYGVNSQKADSDIENYIVDSMQRLSNDISYANIIISKQGIAVDSAFYEYVVNNEIWGKIELLKMHCKVCKKRIGTNNNFCPFCGNSRK